PATGIVLHLILRGELEPGRAGFEIGAQAHPPAVALVLVGLADGVVDLPLALGQHIAGKPCFYAIADATAHRAFEPDLLQRIAVAYVEVAAELLGRRPADDVDRARRGILAEQRALGSAKHLDPFDIEEIDKRRPAGSR